MSKKIYLQCGYEDKCKHRDCLRCRRYIKLKDGKITLAEAVCIEDFAMVDLNWWIKHNPKDLDLSQKIMFKLMKRLKWG